MLGARLVLGVPEVGVRMEARSKVDFSGVRARDERGVISGRRDFRNTV